MKTYRIRNRRFGDFVFSNDWHTLMEKETIRVIDTVLANWWNHTVVTLSKDDEKYLKNAIKIGKLKKATKKQIENDFYITVNVA